MSVRQRGTIPPGPYAGGNRSPIVWVHLCPRCAGYAPADPDPAYNGPLSGPCQGCGCWVTEVHRYKAVIHSAEKCSCPDGHERVHGDLRWHGYRDDPDPDLIAEFAADACEVPS